jgi:photosystem II stability/assembly factor-like uncharacterized protein
MKTEFLKYKILFLSINLFVLNAGNVFAHFGSKGPFGGSVSCGTTYGANTVYIGTPEGGVFETTNASLVSWRARPVGLKTGKITALTHTSSYLFAGTADSGMFIFNGYVGSDRHWIKINNGLSNLKIRSLVSIDTITVLAGTEGGGVFKTSDKGVTWISVNNPTLTNAKVTGLVKAGNRIILTSDSGGIFASDDNGASWFDFNDLHTLLIAGTNSVSYNEMTDELMILNNSGLFIASAVSTTSAPSYTSAQSALSGSAEVRSISNNGSDWFLATSEGVYTSDNSSIGWSIANTGLSVAALDVTTIVPFGTSLVLGTNKEGIFKTAASNLNWISFNANFNNITTYAMATSGDLVVVAATEKGVFVSRDLAANYYRANIGLADSLNVTDMVFAGTKLFASTKNAGVFISADTGRTWNSYNSGLTNLNIKKIQVSALSLYAFSNDDQVYQANAFGWTVFQTGLPSGFVPTSLIYYNNFIYISTLGHGVFLSPESSSLWTSSNAGLSNLNVTSLTTDGNKLYAGTDGSGVFISDLSTVHWSSVSGTSISHTVLMGLNGNKIQSMAFHDGYVYAGYKGGLLASSDHGATWIAAGNQFNLPGYTDVTKISFVTTRVFVTTENNSLYSNALSELPAITTGIINENSINAFFGISPNPSNGNFKINYNAVGNDDINEVSIYNASGRLMDRFSKDVKEISVDYPKGIYLVQINTVFNKMLTQKIIIE